VNPKVKSQLAKVAICTANDRRTIERFGAPDVWLNGMCLVFATALHQTFGYGRLNVLAAVHGKASPMASHVVLEVHGRCIDSLGGGTLKTAIKRHDRWLAKTFKSPPRTAYVPLDQCASNIKCDEKDVADLSEIMRTVASERGLFT